MKRLLILVGLVIALVLMMTGCLEDMSRPDLTQVDEQSQPNITVVDTDSLAGSFKNCGQRLGHHPCNFRLKDQNGDNWQLYNNKGKIIVLDFSTMWCSACVQAATRVNNLLADYPNEDIIWATILLQDLYGMPPSEAVLQEWAKVFDLTEPVLGADLAMSKLIAENAYNVSTLPTMIVIDHNLVIQYVMEGWNEARMRVYLDNIISGDI